MTQSVLLKIEDVGPGVRVIEFDWKQPAQRADSKSHENTTQAPREKPQLQTSKPKK